LIGRVGLAWQRIGIYETATHHRHRRFPPGIVAIATAATTVSVTRPTKRRNMLRPYRPDRHLPPSQGSGGTCCHGVTHNTPVAVPTPRLRTNAGRSLTSGNPCRLATMSRPPNYAWPRATVPAYCTGDTSGFHRVPVACLGDPPRCQTSSITLPDSERFARVDLSLTRIRQSKPGAVQNPTD